MRTGKPKLFTAGATVGLAAVTVGLMALNRMEAVPETGAIVPGAAPVATGTATAGMVGLKHAPPRLDPTQLPDAAPVVEASMAGAPDVPPRAATAAVAAGGDPALPREPETTRAAFAHAAPAFALRDRLAGHAAAGAPALPADGSPAMVMASADTETAAGPAPDAIRVRRNAFGIPCGPMLSGAEAPGGIVALTLTAPCRSGETVTVANGALVFTGKINSLGTLKAEIPAMAEQSDVTVRFADGHEESVSLETPSALAYERVALQWQGAGSGLQIHALEFGADYGESGHVWEGAPRGPEFAVAGRGGYLTRLGDGDGADARLAEVYTFPLGISDRDGVVRLNVEAEITPANCGTDVAGQSLQPALGGGLQVVELSFAMPGCEAVGEFLVLKNVLRDLRVAAN